MCPQNIPGTEPVDHGYDIGVNLTAGGKHATFLKIGRLFSNPLITTVVSIFSSAAIYVLLHLIFSQPFSGFELMLPVIIPTMVAYPISIMFQFFTQELEHSNQSLRLANEEIVSQKKELEELNKVKLKLFSIVAHDLRSPVALLYSYLEFLQEEGKSADDIVNMIPAITEQVHSTIQLMDNLLKWSNTQMHGISPYISRVDLPALLSENAALFKAQLKKKHITLHVENNNCKEVPADLDMLRLVLRNLTANAIKFTPQNGVIQVSLRDDTDSIWVTVQDSGVGISQDDQQKLFRADMHHTTLGTNYERGTGLGLLLCKQFIEKHHGNLRVNSEIGKGSAFTFCLPKDTTP